jgi:hypothetical protein
MGFEPRQIGYLVLAESAGLGVADLEAINVLGDPIASVRRRFIPHSNYRVQRHWNRLETSQSPHIRARAEGKAVLR